MSKEVESSDWLCLDDWWSVYRESGQLVGSSDGTEVFGRKQFTDSWGGVDWWWQVYADSPLAYKVPTSGNILALSQIADSWDELDPWWDVYIETGHETAVDIADVLERSNEMWKESDSPFNTDPLAADLTKNQNQRGPPTPSYEMGWSQWLAQLLAPSAALSSKLFDIDVDQPPDDVILEDRLFKEDGLYRRPDILVHFADKGVSIEVKLGDENYQKTAETAQLIEEEYDELVWTHTLLVPKKKLGRLSGIVDPPVKPRPNGRHQIEWDNPGPISVIYWSNVTAAIRSLLLKNEVVDDQWAANAYLLCAVAEQRLMGFQSKPEVERLAAPGNVVDTLQPLQFADVLEEQLTYLRAGLEV